LRWEPIPEMFPEGLARFREKLGLPLILHNRWFAPENEYLGQYEFVADGGPEMALPADGAIFEELIGNARSWGGVHLRTRLADAAILGCAAPAERRRPRRTLDEIDRRGGAHPWTDDTDYDGGRRPLDGRGPAALGDHGADVDRLCRGSTKTSFWPQFHIVNSWRARSGSGLSKIISRARELGVKSRL